MSSTKAEIAAGQTVTNWAGTVTYHPTTSAHPKTIEDLQAVVRNAVGKVRPRGSGHSWNDAIATTDVSVDVSQLVGQVKTQTVTGKDGRQYVRFDVPSGMNQGDFSLVAQNAGAPLPTQGPAPDITLSGFVANGCHGTGCDQPTIAELVYGLEIVGPQGELLYFDEETVPPALAGLGLAAPDLMNLVRVNLGALGVLSRIVFQIPKEARNILVRQLFPVTTDVFDRDHPEKLDQLLAAYDYVETFWFPYNKFTMKGLTPVVEGVEKDTLWVIAYKWTTEPVSSNAASVNAWTDVVGSLAVFGPALGATVAHLNGLTPAFSRFAVLQTQLKYRFSECIVLRPRDAFLYQKTYFKNFVDLEFTIPVGGDTGYQVVTEAFYQLADRIEAWRTGKSGNYTYPVNLSVHARFIKNSQATLSPAYAPAGASTHTCYIEYLSYSNGDLIQRYLDFNQDFYSPANGLGWKAYGGIPNWGKFLPSVPGVMSYVHGIIDAPAPGGGPSRLASFLNVRDAIDPGGAKFTNDYLSDVFTGTDRPVAATVAPQSRVEPAFIPLADSPPSRTFSVAAHRLVPQTITAASNPGNAELLFHDFAAGVAFLLNRHQEVNVLAVAYDAAKGEITYTPASPSMFFTSDAILDQVAALHA